MAFLNDFFKNVFEATSFQGFKATHKTFHLKRQEVNLVLIFCQNRN